MLNPIKVPRPLQNFSQYLNPIKKYQDSRIASFSPKICFDITIGNFKIKTAQNSHDLMEVLKLRHQIFIEEGLGKSRFTKLDFDKFDLVADHILLIDTNVQKVIGTYRILSSANTHSFYSQLEFTIENFLKKEKGIKLELGRACILPEYRKGVAIHLIWKALGRYAELSSASWMFGCTSLKMESKYVLQAQLRNLQPSYDSQKYEIKARLKFKFFSEPKNTDELLKREFAIPPLLSSYFQAGAKVYGEPAYDRDFKCFDVWTCLNLQTMPERYKKKYLAGE